MGKEDIVRRVCAVYCSFYRPEKSEDLCCKGFSVVRSLIDEGREVCQGVSMKPSEMSDEQLVRTMAKEVMGWELKTQYVPYYWHDVVNDAGGPLESDWQPLTDARHWMMVVERMRELGFSPKIWWDRDRLKWGAAFYSMQAGFIYHQSVGRAVCEAALEAVREGVTRCGFSY